MQSSAKGSTPRRTNASPAGTPRSGKKLVKKKVAKKKRVSKGTSRKSGKSVSPKKKGGKKGGKRTNAAPTEGDEEEEEEEVADTEGVAPPGDTEGVAPAAGAEPVVAETPSFAIAHPETTPVAQVSPLSVNEPVQPTQPTGPVATGPSSTPTDPAIVTPSPIPASLAPSRSASIRQMSRQGSEKTLPAASTDPAPLVPPTSAPVAPEAERHAAANGHAAASPRDHLREREHERPHERDDRRESRREREAAYRERRRGRRDSDDRYRSMRDTRDFDREREREHDHDHDHHDHDRERDRDRDRDGNRERARDGERNRERERVRDRGRERERSDRDRDRERDRKEDDRIARGRDSARESGREDWWQSHERPHSSIEGRPRETERSRRSSTKQRSPPRVSPQQAALRVLRGALRGACRTVEDTLLGLGVFDFDAAPGGMSASSLRMMVVHELRCQGWKVDTEHIFVDNTRAGFVVRDPDLLAAVAVEVRYLRGGHCLTLGHGDYVRASRSVANGVTGDALRDHVATQEDFLAHVCALTASGDWSEISDMRFERLSPNGPSLHSPGPLRPAGSPARIPSVTPLTVFQDALLVLEQHKQALDEEELSLRVHGIEWEGDTHIADATEVDSAVVLGVVNRCKVELLGDVLRRYGPHGRTPSPNH